MQDAPADPRHRTRAGEPDVIVLVHGGLDRRESMARLERACAGLGPEVVRYDRRGYGTEAGHPGPHTVSGNAEDLSGVVAGRRAVVFGHSFGGVVALAAAARDRSIVGVATYEAPLSWLDSWPKPAWADPGDPALAAESFVRRLAGNAAWESLSESVKANRRAEGATLIAELTDCRSAPPFSAEGITVPVRVGHGEAGMEHHKAGARRLAEMLPEAALVEIGGASHFAHRSHATAIAERLIAPLVVPRR